MTGTPARIIHDADSHVMESPDWFAPFADPGVRERLQPLFSVDAGPDTAFSLDALERKHADPDWRAKAEDEIWLRKNWSALGSFKKEDRPRALDLLGFATQLVFNTFANKQLQAAEQGDDAGAAEFAYGLARAHNRAIVDFCSVDSRLLPVGYVPLMDFERSKAFAAEALDLGCKALMIASACPRTHSPSHVGLDPVWAQAQEAGVPIVLHVGGGGKLLDPMYFENGLPPVPDFHGGDGNFRSVDYMAISYPLMQTLATMIIDGVLHRFPDLRIGVIEQGAAWVPGWMRSMDSAATAFRRNEERLQQLDMEPSGYVQRQIRVTPYPHEDAGWCIEQGGEDVFMFSSDFPHVEGGRNPLGRFSRSLEGVSAEAQERFYRTNFEDLMGAALPARR
jgi:predicted TIM-barrel fold metal-dependent hydrolase